MIRTAADLVSETTFERFADYQPTAHDMRGLGSDDDDANWLVFPMTYQPKCASMLDDSNWEATLKCLADVDPSGNDYTVHYFGHWASDFKIVVLRPGSAAHIEAERIAAALSDYPVLDDEDFSMRECEAQFESVEDGLHRLTIERDGTELDGDALSELAGQICSNASSSEEMDRDDIERALGKLGYVLCEDDTWRPEGETEPA